MSGGTDALAPFIIFALPRSRTAWLSHWLSYVRTGERIRSVGHDSFSRCGSIEECLGLFEQGLNGTVETGAAFAYPRIKELMPQARLLVVQRDPVDCLKSLLAKGVRPDPLEWAKRVQDLWAVSGDGVRTVAYADLNLSSCARWIWEYCLGLSWDSDWWDYWSPINIQVDMGLRQQELLEGAERIAKLKQEVSTEELAMRAQDYPHIWPKSGLGVS